MYTTVKICNTLFHVVIYSLLFVTKYIYGLLFDYFSFPFAGKSTYGSTIFLEIQ